MAGEFIDGPAPDAVPPKAKKAAKHEAAAAKPPAQTGRFIDAPSPPKPAPREHAPTPGPTPAPHATPTAPATPNPQPVPDPRLRNAPGSSATRGAPGGYLGTQIPGLVGSALDFQRFHTWKAAGLGNTTDEQLTNLRKHLGAEGLYQSMGHMTIPGPMGVPLPGHLAQGSLDTALLTAGDPLTLETFGMGGVRRVGARVLEAAGKEGASAATRAAAAAIKTVPRANTAVMNWLRQTPVGNELHRAFHWGGGVELERGTPFVDQMRGTANVASSTGRMTTDRMKAAFDRVEASLTPQSKVHVGRALNGQIPDPLEDPQAYSPAERRAYHDLRRLTELDYRIRLQTARAVQFQRIAGKLAPADRTELYQSVQTGKEPVIPKPTKRVRVPYGEEQPRTRAAPGAQRPDLKAVFEQQMKDLSADDAQTLRKAWVADPEGTKPAPAEFSEDLRTRLASLQKADREAFSLSAQPQVPIKPGRRYTNQPGNQAEIDRMTRLNDLYHQVETRVELSMPYRQNYMPWAHTPAETTGRASRTISPADHWDPHSIQREDVQVTKPEQLRSGFESMAENTGQQVRARITHELLGPLLDDPEIEKLFSKTLKATGAQRTNLDKVKDAWLGVVGYPRAATVSLTPRHAVNILDLAANTVPIHEQPAYFARVASLAKKIALAKNPTEYARVTREGRLLGAISGNYRERQAFFQNVPLLKNWTALNNRLVWAVDEAAKIEYAKLLAKSGEAQGLEAGGLAAKRLVDYEHTSPFVDKVLRYVAPFGTFRGSIPGAVLGGLKRNPARAALWNRATGGLMYGGQPQPFGHGTEMYNPTADVSRGADFLTPLLQGAQGVPRSQQTETGPATYLRSTLGAIPRGAAAMGAEFASGEGGASLTDLVQEARRLPAQIQHRYWAGMGVPEKRAYAEDFALKRARFLTYHKPVDLRFILDYAASGVPGAATFIAQLGLGQFKPKPLAQDVLQQVTGVGVK